MSDLDEIVHEFLVESHENLDQLDRDLVALEEQPDSRPLLASVFRTIHTIKGTSGFLAFSRLEEVTHVGEGLLSLLRDGGLRLSPEITSLLLELVDAVRSLLGEIERTGTEGQPDHRSLIVRLRAVSSLAAAAPPDTAPAEPRLGEKLVERGLVRPDDVALAVLEQTVGDNRPIGEILVEHGAVDPHALHETLEGAGDVRRSVADSSVRVDVEVLDNLMRLVGELVLTRNQIASGLSSAADLGLTRAFQRLNAIATDLQDGVVGARMQPIDSVWSKLPRLVRDLCRQMGKQARLEFDGADTELDRSVLEAVKDPLTHLVRNALDHGIEPPEQRRAAGKPDVGRLLLRAYHEGGHVYLEITDDGAGIDPVRIGEAAVRKGLLSTEQVAGMGRQELLGCIFLPGFSTADQVTNVSGRGVGMDVVKTNMERIGGSVDVLSEVGSGTTFRVKIPLTLAIVSALIVRCGAGRYAIPQSNVLELVRLDAADRRERIETISGAPVYRLRGTLLPLLPLAGALGLAPASDTARSGDYIVVLGTQDRQFGLVVDDVLDTEDIVVKPLCDALQSLELYAGATILGDGRVALILDVWAVAHTHQIGVAAGAEVEAEVSELRAEAAVLVVRVDAERLLAVPLDRVTRLEDVPAERVEQVGARQALQYRGGILPIVRLVDLVGGAAPAGVRDSLQVVIYTERGRSVGLVVHEVLDIAADDLTELADIDGPGVAGQTVVGQRVMELLDVRAAILAADPHFYDADEISAGVEA